MEIIRRRQTITETSFDLVFPVLDKSDAAWYVSGSGFSFPCDEKGVVQPLPEAAQENLEKCYSGEHNVGPSEVRKSEFKYTEPAVGRCVRCKREVILCGFTNTCNCGADYNMSGQLLADRSQWGEETGEHLSDILMIP
jgi:hypothetical protein